MENFKELLEQMGSMAKASAAQSLIQKRASALDLTIHEHQLDVAKAQVKVVEADLAGLRFEFQQLDTDASEAEIGLLEAKIEVAKKALEGCNELVEALTSLLAAKQEYAELMLEMDPNALGGVIDKLRGNDSTD